MCLDSKVTEAARRNGPPIAKFGAEVAAILNAAALFTTLGVRSTIAPHHPSHRRDPVGLTRIIRGARGFAMRPFGIRRSTVNALGSEAELVKSLDTLLSSKLVVAMEPTLRRQGQHLITFVLDNFDDNFGAVVAFGDCGPGSRFSKQANSLRRCANLVLLCGKCADHV
jgi:hypothetical protein